jgi:hypothetical protein
MPVRVLAESGAGFNSSTDFSFQNNRLLVFGIAALSVTFLFGRQKERPKKNSRLRLLL